MTRVACFAFLLAMTAADLLTVVAQDQPPASPRTPSSPAEPVRVGAMATATTGKFNAARPPEPRGPEKGKEVWIPRSKRWRMHWTPADLQEYSRQLDYFKIELAVAGGGQPLLDYVFNVSQPRPDSRRGAGAAEKRLCMSWSAKSGELVDFDKKLLARAGIPVTNRMLLQVYPAKVEDQLAWLEKKNTEREGRKFLEGIRMTTFGVRRKGEGYEIYVAKQEFRKAAAKPNLGTSK